MGARQFFTTLHTACTPLITHIHQLAFVSLRCRWCGFPPWSFYSTLFAYDFPPARRFFTPRGGCFRLNNRSHTHSNIHTHTTPYCCSAGCCVLAAAKARVALSRKIASLAFPALRVCVCVQSGVVLLVCTHLPTTVVVARIAPVF